MKQKIIMMAVTMFLERLSADDLKVWIDKGLDLIEDKVIESEGKTDDALVLPLCALVRDALSIPDND